MGLGANWVEVNAAALAANFQVICEQVGKATEVVAVIKANGYGHGAESCAPILVRAGAKWLGVTCAGEGVRVRQALVAAGLAAEILIMSGFLPGDLNAIAEAELTPVLWTMEQIGWLDGLRTKVHVEIDTGMGRQGARPGDELGVFLEALREAGLELDGVFTHFCSSEVSGSALTRTQEERFEEAVAQVEAAKLRPRFVHAGNSSNVDNSRWPVLGDASRRDPRMERRDPWMERLAARVGARAMVRTGLALYGYCLPIELPEGVEAQAVAGTIGHRLRPVMTWKARVLAVRELEPGETVGYGATFTANQPMRVALLPVGYADGLRREFSSGAEGAGGWVMVRGQRAPVLGRVSMNLTVVDVTAIPGVRAGDEVVVLGEGITAEDHARQAGTIAYEILCGVHPCG